MARMPGSKQLKQVKTLAQVLRWLKKRKVSRKLWGTPPWRSLDDLMEYHTRDRLFFRRGKQPVIEVHPAVVTIYHRYRNQWWELYEEKQVFRNGRVRRRNGFDGAAETMKRAETKIAGARRCLKEELGWDDPSLYDLSRCLKIQRRDPQPSEKWHGLTAIYVRHIFRCVISRQLFDRKGYMHIDKGIRIYFKWRLVNRFAPTLCPKG